MAQPRAIVGPSRSYHRERTNCQAFPRPAQRALQRSCARTPSPAKAAAQTCCLQDGGGGEECGQWDSGGCFCYFRFANPVKLPIVLDGHGNPGWNPVNSCAIKVGVGDRLGFRWAINLASIWRLWGMWSVCGRWLFYKPYLTRVRRETDQTLGCEAAHLLCLEQTLLPG